MSEIKDGGPAFPQPLGTETVAGCEGLSLRDWFAGKAIEGTLPGAMLNVDDYAKLAYRMADAMLRARGQS